MSILLTGLTGLVAGSTHVVSGPDHLAAVLPLAVEGRWRAAAIGAWWGVGHAAGVLILGAVGHLLAHQLDIETLSAWSELAVGFLLVGLGGWTLWRSGRPPSDRPEHTHGSALAIGFLHGTAGAGHLFGVLPSLGMSPGMAAVYLVAYMMAAVASMSLFALCVGTLTHKPSRVRWVLRCAGVVAIGVGIAWIALAA